MTICFNLSSEDYLLRPVIVTLVVHRVKHFQTQGPENATNQIWTLQTSTFKKQKFCYIIAR